MTILRDPVTRFKSYFSFFFFWLIPRYRYMTILRDPMTRFISYFSFFFFFLAHPRVSIYDHLERSCDAVYIAHFFFWLIPRYRYMTILRDPVIIFLLIPRYRYMTILRDPVTRFISHFSFFFGSSHGIDI